MATKTERNTEVSSSDRMSSDLEHLKSSFSQLRQDVVDVLGQTLGLGRSGADYAKDGANHAMENVKARLAELKQRGADSVSSVEKQIEDRPLQAALIAFGVGFIVAKFLSRR